MLKGIDPILSPELLYALRAMGHGDEIVIADANFPAQSISLEATGEPCLRLDGISATDVLAAILSVMPLDSFVPAPAHCMQVVGNDPQTPPIVTAFEQIINDRTVHPAPLAHLERFAFYERAKSAFAVVQTGERRLYGNIILTKGIVTP